MKSRLVSMHCREADGSLHLIDHVYQYPLTERKSPEMPEDRFCSGGGGCFGTLVEYCSKYQCLNVSLPDLSTADTNRSMKKSLQPS